MVEDEGRKGETGGWGGVGRLDPGRAVKAEGDELRKLLEVKCHAKMQSYDFMQQAQEMALAPAILFFMYNNPLV